MEVQYQVQGDYAALSLNSGMSPHIPVYAHSHVLCCEPIHLLMLLGPQVCTHGGVYPINSYIPSLTRTEAIIAYIYKNTNYLQMPQPQMASMANMAYALNNNTIYGYI